MFLEALASCHAITYVDGKLVGDPLDVKMFESTGWIFDEANTHQASQNWGEEQIVIGYVYPKGGGVLDSYK